MLTPTSRRRSALFQLHIRRSAREKYALDAALFAFNGRAILTDFRAAHDLAAKINASRTSDFVRAGEINALALLHELSHRVLQLFRAQKNPQLFAGALQVLAADLGAANLEATLEAFVAEFPPQSVYAGQLSAREYLQGTTEGTAHREAVLEEMLLLHLANLNPAAAKLRELFDESALAGTSYASAIEFLKADFKRQQPFGPRGEGLCDLLASPFLHEPASLSAQLRWVRENWGFELVGDLLNRLLRGVDMSAEEEKPVFHGPGPAQIPDYRRARLRSEVELEEPEAFSDDRDWMPRVVMLAKNAYVWLEQLCRKYSRSITSLDQIPDEELDQLQAQGFSALWLIGLWERSRASKTIKQKCGNEGAEASAYSLLRYEIADDLGGWPALHNLKERALQRGIRMASDMVPNHTGMDSDWVTAHPDWFVSLDHAPFPTYTFNGPNLSSAEHIGLFLEDHYYSREDAAVVFQRVDYLTNDVRYIYHGNDGTSMPWNDTAQLNYLRAEVREALIQTILHVARSFPIIRFDAAMTLAKRHFQRLWFPEPGTGGDIPSRSWFGLSMDEFDALMPQEFWREVVDRAAVEAPDTLLLAEAFWMMEGYFVRSLGMHRVYNSAFMNMLRDEKNEEYRLVLKNTLEFDAGILNRFVNFLNNPDEETASEQFGDGDKYFGAATLLATLPGLPMFGHGQIEGLREKYGMEYRAARWHETPNAGLVQRHERELFPLMRHRALFAGVDNFALFDLWRGDGRVDENVFAFSNFEARSGERGLIVFHNKFGQTSGWIKTSAAFFDKERRELRQQSLQEALRLSGEERKYLKLRDVASGLEFLHLSREVCERGLFLELRAYERRAFVDIEELHDADGRLAQLCFELKGAGVPSVATALRERELRPTLEPFEHWFEAGLLKRLMPSPCFAVASSDLETAPASEAEAVDFAALDEWEARGRDFFRALEEHAELKAPPLWLAARGRDRLARLLALHAELPGESGAPAAWAREHLSDAASWGLLISWCALCELPEALRGQPQVLEGAPLESEGSRASFLDEWLLGLKLEQAWVALDIRDGSSKYLLGSLRALLDCSELFEPSLLKPEGAAWKKLFANAEAARVLGVNRHQGRLWFNREAWEEWSSRASIAALLQAEPGESGLGRAFAHWQDAQQEAQSASFDVEVFVAADEAALEVPAAVAVGEEEEA